MGSEEMMLLDEGNEEMLLDEGSEQVLLLSTEVQPSGMLQEIPREPFSAGKRNLGVPVLPPFVLSRQPLSEGILYHL